jgi:pilus assembly protein FimV
MTRKLAFALSLLGVLFAESVLALGIGEVTVKSALNQPLKAEIELLSSADLTAEEILPGLATREEFLKANVDRVYFLSDLRFNVITNDQGKLVVVLTTNKPVREPFLNFLVEVIWPSGRLLREYALLIDPPVFAEQQAAPVNVAPAQPAVEQTTQSGDVFRIPSEQSSSKRSVANPSVANGGGTYGATDSNDTLWDIALKARPNRSVSPQQVMLAIQDLNPGAFIKKNINKLKAGQVLRLPTLDQVKARSSHQAIEQVIAQNESARGKRTKSVASSANSQPANTSPSSSKASEDELKLVVADKNSDAASSANAGSANQSSSNSRSVDPNIAVTLEKLDKANIENTELNGRVTDLEEQLQTLQRLLTLKNDQLANIQTQMRANELAKAQAEVNDSKMSVDAGSQGMAADAETNEVADAANNKAEVAVQEDKKQVEASLDVAAQGDMQKDVQPANEAAPAEIADTAQQPVNINGQGEPESENIVAVIIGNTLYLAIAVLVIIALVVVLWLISRNNAKREEEFQALHSDEGYEEEPLDDDQETYGHSDEEEMASELPNDQVDAVSDEEEYIDADLYSEDSVEDGSKDGSEGEDVIAEADVYIAYGRLDQAASVLESEISVDPVRTDLRLKLLEVYKSLGDTSAFNRQYSELEAIQDVDALEAANAIRSDMLDEQLVSVESKEHELDLDRLDGEAEEAQREAESSIVAEVEALEDEPVSSFDFDSVELDEDDAELDLDLDAALGGEPQDLAPLEDVSLDDELLQSEDTIDSIADELSHELSDDDFDDSILDVDLDDIDLSGELEQETEIQLPSDLSESAIVDSLAQDGLSDVEAALDGGDDSPVISDDILEQAAEKLNADESFDEDLGDAGDFDFLEGTDEASTKLDLARAYIDMGDVDGAKDILEEVSKEGNPEQQTEAADLLKSIDA